MFFLILFNSLFGQVSNKKLALTIHIDQEITLHGSYFWEQLTITGSDFSRSISFSDNTVRLDTLRNDKYTITLVSRFGQRITKSVKLESNQQITFKTKSKLKKVKPKNFIRKALAADTLYILHNVTGNSVNKQQFKIYAVKGLGYMEKYRNRVLEKKVKLSVSDQNFLMAFEMQLMKADFSAGCSVLETYTFCYRGKYFSVNDGSCAWNGISKINERFFKDTD